MKPANFRVPTVWGLPFNIIALTKGKSESICSVGENNKKLVFTKYIGISGSTGQG